MAARSSYGVLSDAMYSQTDPLKEVKDMSKNLVSGDFEREYRGVLEKRGRRRQACAVTVVLAFVVAFLWLLALTLVREVQVVRLREDLERLSANMIVLSARLESLNQKVANNKLFNDYKAVDDLIYTDDLGPTKEGNPLPSSSDEWNEDVERPKHITTVELDDEEDAGGNDYVYENDDEEDTTFEYDYDKKRDQVGQNNMVKLTPEDFIGAVVTLGKDKTTNSLIHKIKQKLNENPEVPDDVLKDMTYGNIQEHKEKEPERVKRSVFPDYPQEFDQVAHPAATTKYDDRRKSKKYVRSPPAVFEQPHLQGSHTSGRIVRNSDDEEGGSKRPFVAAHFHGNTSHLSTEIHEHYKGNGLVRVSHDAPHDVWYPSPWTLASPHRPTLTRNGHVHVHHTGVYLVYVQIYYLDSHDIISWVLHRTNPEMSHREAVLQCAQSSHAPGAGDRPNSCFSAAALFLKAGDRLAVRNTGGDRHSLMQPEKSFIGLVKLADANDPNDIEL